MIITDPGNRPSDRRHPPRPTLAAFLSALVPGAGQWYGGRRFLAVVLVSVAGLGLAGAVWLVTLGPTRILEIFVQIRWLWVLFAANLVVLLARLFAVGDAFWAERSAARRRSGGRPPIWSGALVVLLLAATAVPHIVVADYSLEAIDLLETVFADGELPSAEDRIEQALAEGVDPADLGPELSTTTTSATGSSEVTASTTLGRLPLSDGATIPAADPSSLPDELRGLEPELARVISDRMALAAAFPFGIPLEGPLTDGADRITVLLAGGDAGPQRWSLRTDVMILATFDLISGKAALIGISRDLSNIPLPAAFDQAFVDRELQYAEAAGVDTSSLESCRCWPDRLNGLYTFTLNWYRTFPDAPDPGMEALRRTLSLLTGIPIDYYVLVDMAGFVDLVDAIGGVEVTINEAMDVAFSPAREGEDPVSITVEPGRHELDGHQALAYVRDRTDTNDGHRMQRQRCMLRALAAEMTPGTLVSRFSEIARAIKTSTTTNIPLAAVPELIELAAGLSVDDITTLAIGAPAHVTGTDYRGLPAVDAAKVRSRIAAVLAGLEAAQLGDQSECP